MLATQLQTEVTGAIDNSLRNVVQSNIEVLEGLTALGGGTHDYDQLLQLAAHESFCFGGRAHGMFAWLLL